MHLHLMLQKIRLIQVIKKKISMTHRLKSIKSGIFFNFFLFPGSSPFQFGNNNTPIKTTSIPSAFATSSTTSNALAPSTNLFSTSPYTFGQKTESNANSSVSTITTTANTTFGSNSSGFGFNTIGANPTSLNTPNTTASNLFGIPSATNTNSMFGTTNQTNPSTKFGGGLNNAPAFGTGTNNVFNVSSNTQNPSPAFGVTNTSSNLFSSGTTPSNQPSFGTSSNLFNFAQQPQQQSSLPQPTTTASSGIFGTAPTNANSPFVFGRSNNNNNQLQSTNSPSSGIFSAKPQNNVLSAAPPAFGKSSGFCIPPIESNSVFGQDSKPAFIFNQPNNNNATNVPAFGSTTVAATAPPQFGSNTMNSPFSFNRNNQDNNPSKPFDFNRANTAPVATASASPPFSFQGQTNPSPVPNAMCQFQQQAAPATNIFMITPTAKSGRPIARANRRIK